MKLKKKDGTVREETASDETPADENRNYTTTKTQTQTEEDLCCQKEDAREYIAHQRLGAKTDGDTDNPGRGNQRTQNLCADTTA